MFINATRFIHAQWHSTRFQCFLFVTIEIPFFAFILQYIHNTSICTLQLAYTKTFISSWLIPINQVIVCLHNAFCGQKFFNIQLNSFNLNIVRAHLFGSKNEVDVVFFLSIFGPTEDPIQFNYVYHLYFMVCKWMFNFNLIHCRR